MTDDNKAKASSASATEDSAKASSSADSSASTELARHSAGNAASDTDYSAESAEGKTYSARSQDSKSASEKAKKPAKTGALWFFTFINFCLIVGAGAAGYWFYTQHEQGHNNSEEEVAQVQRFVDSEVKALSASISQLERELESKNDALNQSLDGVLAQVLANAQSDQTLANELAEVSGRRPSDWLLAEANYLVNMAGRKLYLEQDLRTAIALLNEADARLQDLGDPSLLPIRALIASDIQSLQQVNPMSTTSIALAISGLLPQVSQLPLENLKLPEAEPEENTELSSDVADWRENLSIVWEDIVGDFITVTPVNKPLSPYLAERQQWLIEQQLKHALTQAKSAALDEHFTLYQSALQEAMALIIEHYQIEENSVVQFTNALQQLQNSNFERDYPQKLMAVDALKDATERRLQRQFESQLGDSND
ncbi:uroporphyrinogen-III C-methyltransferase [Ningiella sp. W23]|uniref:uroporphyrinogen-III C-methyltransferase n=1 Tax=Ningiella sp. W23 TaxID=3023715 RepID=UPI0037577BF6